VGLGQLFVLSSLREYQVSLLERQYEGTRPLTPHYADGRRCCHKRGEEGPLRPSMTIFFLGGHERLRL
jgi:hypothetical protein